MSASKVLCPKCGNKKQWRSGVGFENEMICMKCDCVFEPEKSIEINKEFGLLKGLALSREFAASQNPSSRGVGKLEFKVSDGKTLVFFLVPDDTRKAFLRGICLAIRQKDLEQPHGVTWVNLVDNPTIGQFVGFLELLTGKQVKIKDEFYERLLDSGY